MNTSKEMNAPIVQDVNDVQDVISDDDMEEADVVREQSTPPKSLGPTLSLPLTEAEPLSPMSRSDSSVSSSDSFCSFISSLSCDESHVEGLHGAELLDVIQKESWEKPSLKSQQKDDGQDLEMSHSLTDQTQFEARNSNAIPAVSSSSASSSRDSRGVFRMRKRNSEPSTRNKDLSNNMTTSLRPLKSYLRGNENILPPLSLRPSRSLTSRRPAGNLDDVAETSMASFPNFQSPTSVAANYSPGAILRDHHHSLPGSLPRPKLHRRTTSNSSSVFSGSESSAFPIVGYLSDENSRAILQQGSEDQSFQQSSVEDRKKQSWAAKEMKYLKKKLAARRNKIIMNKKVELRRANGYLM